MAEFFEVSNGFECAQFFFFYSKHTFSSNFCRINTKNIKCCSYYYSQKTVFGSKMYVFYKNLHKILLKKSHLKSIYCWFFPLIECLLLMLFSSVFFASFYTFSARFLCLSISKNVDKLCGHFTIFDSHTNSSN